MSKATKTTDHDTIRKWVEERGGHPATVSATHQKDDPGLLRIDFDGKEPEFEEIDWETFFEKFDEKHLAFIYQERTDDGSVSRFCKLIDQSAE